MKDIRIFVSTRIDLDCDVIDNPLYYPVRCGAIYDDNLNLDIQGDNTGDNISDKRESFCEFTVQYWAWKNVKADYYGLCHYRRYLSFSDKNYNTNERNQIVEPYISDKTYEKFGFDNPEQMSKHIEKYDAIIADITDVRKIHTPKGYMKSVYKHWQACDGILIEKKYLDLLIKTIEKLHPEYLECAYKYLKGRQHIGYNCYILKKELFNKLNEFEFDIMFDLEKQIDSTNYHETMNRTIGYLGEILYGIFMYSIINNKSYKVDKRQLIFFDDTKRQEKLKCKDNEIPIIIPVDDINIPYARIKIQSILNNADKGQCFHFIVVSYNIQKNNEMKIIQTILNNSNAKVSFLNPKPYLYALDNNYEYINIESNLLFLPWLLEDFNKVIFLNGISIINCDLSNLYNIELSNGMMVAAVTDYRFICLFNSGDELLRQYCDEKLKMQNPYEYFDTGVVLMDLEQIRNKFTDKDIMKIIQSEKYREQGKDVFNVAYANIIKKLDDKWNTIIYAPETRQHLDYFSPVKLLRQYKSSLKDPYIVQYNFDAFPFIRTDLLEAEYFWKIARKSPMYEEILSRLVDMKGIGFGNQNRRFLNLNRFWRSIVDFLVPQNSLQKKIIKKIIAILY